MSDFAAYGQILAAAGANFPLHRRISPLRPAIFASPPSHSCEGRNLYAEGGNCTISRRFAAAEIPAFAGMELKRFRLSPEWRHF
ncbi:MAG: hypothetical protein ACR2QC_03215 [Gammaproteobacteria bacterium]